MNNQKLQFGQPLPPEDFYLCFTADINPQTTEAVIAAMSNIVGQGAKKIVLLLSSPGGAVMSGLTLYDFIRSLPIPVETHNMANVDSIANMVFQAGTRRTCSKHSTFMFHGVGFTPNGPHRWELKDLKETMQSIQRDQDRIGAILLDRTKLSKERVGQLFLEASTEDANFAIEHRIVDEIVDIKIPDGAPIISMVFNR